MNKTTAALRPYDILSGRSKSCFNNIGNRRFRITVSLNVKRYNSIATRSGRARFIESFARTLKDDVGFRFLRILKNGEKVELSEEEARAKIGHALRDLSLCLRKAASKPPNKRKTAMRKMKATKTRTMKFATLKPRSTTTKIWTAASASQRPSVVAESMMPSLDENKDSNTISSNHGREKDWNVHVAVSPTSFLPSREQGLEEFGFFPLDMSGCDTATAQDDDDSLLPHLLQHELEDPLMSSDLLPSSFGECSHLRVVSMPLNNPSTTTEENSYPDSNPFFHDFDTKAKYSSFFSSPNKEEEIATCSMSTDDHDRDDDEDLSVSFA
eukprot:scaffold417_cov97-Cylindrotheca_fusiformis.AAC.1